MSAAMSAAMVKMGIYGILLLTLRLLPGGPRWWSIVLVALGAGSALYGILQASVQADLKKLLAYSTTENIGLITTAIGVGTAPARAPARTPLPTSPSSQPCCWPSAMPRSSPSSSSAPARCCTRPVSATSTCSVALPPACRGRRRPSGSAPSGPLRCRSPPASSRSGRCCSRSSMWTPGPTACSPSSSRSRWASSPSPSGSGCSPSSRPTASASSPVRGHRQQPRPTRPGRRCAQPWCSGPSSSSGSDWCPARCRRPLPVRCRPGECPPPEAPACCSVPSTWSSTPSR